MMHKNFVKYWEYIIPIAAIVSLITSCFIVSSKRFYWNDELFSWYLLSDPSFTSMLQAFSDKINNTPPLYFILGWGWVRVFGASEISLRLFSSLGICMSLVLVWATLRRNYGFWATSISVLTVFCTSGLILGQNAEARMYGLYLAVSALALLLYDTACRKETASGKILIAFFGVHAALIHTHLHGLFFSGALLTALFVSDFFVLRVWRPRLYLAVVLGWLTVVFYLPTFLVQADAGLPRAWMPIPTLQDLLALMSFNLGSLASQFALGLMVLGFGLQFVIGTGTEPRRAHERPAGGQRTEFTLLILGYAWLLVPIPVWLISHLIKPIFYGRYLIPIALAWCILLACVLDRILPAAARVPLPVAGAVRVRPWWRGPTAFRVVAVPALLSVALLLAPLFYAWLYAWHYREQPSPGTDDYRAGHQGLPVVVQNGGMFLQRLHYSPNRDKYFYILDREAALDEASGSFDLQEYKHLEALKRNYPDLFKEQVIESDTFLEMHDRFLVLDYSEYYKECPEMALGITLSRTWRDVHCPQWVEKRLLSNPAYRVTPLSGARLRDGQRMAVLLVERTDRIPSPHDSARPEQPDARAPCEQDHYNDGRNFGDN